MNNSLESRALLLKSLLPLVNALMKSYHQYPSISLAAPSLELLGAGALPDEYRVPGLIIGSIALVIEAAKTTKSLTQKQPWKNFNLILVGLRNAPLNRKG
jgi:hypothetical protein